MATNAIIFFQFAGLPANYCYTTPNRFALDIAAALSGYVPGQYSIIIRSETEPAAADRDKVWIQINSDGAATGKIFTYAYGKWVMLNPRRSVSERVWWTGSESAAWSYDGGDGTNPTSNPPTATTGAMWQRDTDFDAKFPLQAGTLASGVVLAPGNTGGVEDVTLTLAQLPTNHQDWRIEGSGSGDISGNDVIQGDVGTGPQTGTLVTGPNGGGMSHTNLGPYRVGMWLKPTSRLYFTS